MYTPAYFNNIVKQPNIAYPTIILSISCVLLEICVLFLLIKHSINKYIACVCNTIIIYASFTPMHDASHGSIATSKYYLLNSIIGNLSSFCFPLPFSAFKYLHLLHHKHTNEPNDPDLWAGSGPLYLLPLKWLTIELKYYFQYLPIIHLRPKFESMIVIFELVLYLFIFSRFVNYNLTEELIWGWIIPGRLALALLAYFFDYLPHRPHKIAKKDNIYQATSVTSLYKDVTHYITWPLLHQNYHNIHHLAPYIPFYNYSVVWNKMKNELILKGTKIKSII